jgi:DNA-binding transcriptional LysR family regulator
MIGGWDGIEEFLAVARAESFTRGAKAFGASTTHMSRAVARLENRLDVQLMIRTTRSLHLTDTGRLFLEHCQRLVDERDEAMASIGAKGEPKGSLNLTCSYALGEQFVAPLVREFAQAHPALSVTIDLDNDIVDIVTRGFDLAIRTGHLEDSRLIATRIAERTMVTVASPGYISRRGEPLGIDELSEHDCLVGSASLWHFQKERSFRPRGRWKCNNGIAVLDACLAGMGICQLPAFYMKDHLAAGRLEEVLADEKPDNEPIWAVYPTRRHLSPKVSLLVGHLKDRLQTLLDHM